MHPTRSFFASVANPTIATLALALASPTAFADVIFVDASQSLATALQTGATWGTAYKSLQTAIGQAVSGDEIWVAEGTYKPTTTNDRSISFVIPSGVKLYGGFQVGATTITERDPFVHQSILSGAIGGPAPTDNTFSVVRLTNTASGTVLSGFVVTGGHADGGGSSNFGGGVRVAGVNAVPRISECFFVDNFAVSGSAVQFTGATANPTLVNCVVAGNQGFFAIDVQNSTVGIFLCTIVDNDGTGIRFLNNTLNSSVANSIVRGNGDDVSGSDQISAVNSTPQIVACNATGVSGSSMINLDPLFADPDGADDIFGTFDDNYRLRGDSPNIDRGSSQNMPGDAADLDDDGVIAEQVSLDGALNTRRIDDQIGSNAGLGSTPHPDIGAFEYQRPRTIFVNHAAVGLNNGTSWQNAYTDLQDAIAELADIKFGGPGEIWVAKGTYKPTDGTDATISFKPSRGTKIFGGFAGGEASRVLRDPVAHDTILSGDIGAPGPSGNTNAVLRFSGTFVDATTLVDGCTIRDGVSVNGPGPGGGIRFENGSSAIVANCRITNCTGNGSGAISFQSGGTSSPTLLHSIVAGNPASSPGLPALFVASGAPKIIGTVVAGNTAPTSSASAVAIANGAPSFANCLIFANTTGGSSGFAAQLVATGGTASISRSAIQNFNAALEPDASFIGCFAVAFDGDVADANGLDGLFGTSDDNYEPTACSSLVDAGSAAFLPADSGDVDDDGDVLEPWPVDADRNNRVVDLAAPNVVASELGALDIGAIERPVQQLADPDYDNDGDVDGADLAVLLGAWNAFGNQFDLNGDCVVDAADIAILLGAWS